MMTKKTLGTSTAVALNVLYDNAYRSTKYDWVKSGETLVGFTYGYSSAGNKNYEEKLHDTDKSQYYYYDGVYRLTSYDEGTLNGGKTAITSPDYYQDWTLDGLGNWDEFYDNTGTPEYRQHTSTNETEYRGASAPTQAANHTYDDNGNLTDDGTYEYEYDALNRLIKVLKKDDPDFTVGEYAYDARNRRIWREADEDNDESTDADLMYFYDDWQVVEERDYSDEGLLRDYVYGNYIDEPIYGQADTNNDGDFLDSGEKFYYVTNTQYSVTAILDTSGDILERYEYTPYGQPTIYTGDGGDGDWFDGDETTGSLTGNYYLFTGRRLDPETGLYHFRYRYYSAELGRFVSRDPIGYYDSMNLYSYVFNSPTDFIDPFGLYAQISVSWDAARRKCIVKISLRVWFSRTKYLDEVQCGETIREDHRGKTVKEIIIQEIQAAWTKTLGKYDVRTEVDVRAKPPLDEPFVERAPLAVCNRITISKDKKIHDVKRYRHGRWGKNIVTQKEVHIIGHEAGHLIGHREKYTVIGKGSAKIAREAEKGWEGNIMAAEKPFKYEEKNIEEILLHNSAYTEYESEEAREKCRPF